MKIYPVGFHRKIKDQIISMVSKKDQDKVRRLLRTGEENAVIFARVSRAAGSLESIAAEIDEEGAVKFHQKWTVSVEGYGHKSVGEHAILQIAVEDLSSKDVDSITDNRLASFTEFSARFKGRQGRSYFIPKSVSENKKVLKLWTDSHDLVFNTCDELTEKGKEWIMTEEARNIVPQLKQGYYKLDEVEASWQSRLTKHAADQFKNLLPASRDSSVGITMNATEGENAIKKFLSSASESMRQAGKMFKEASLEIAPTLVKYAEFNPYLASIPLRREKMIKIFKLKSTIKKRIDKDGARTDIVTSSDPETLILAAFAFESSNTGSFKDLVSQIDKFSKKKKQAMFQVILGDKFTFNDFEFGKIVSLGLGDREMPPRAFEFDGGYIFEMPDMTYGDWRDYKRHRIQSYISKPFDIKWGYMIPPLVKLMDQSKDKKYHGSEKAVRTAVEALEEVYKVVYKINSEDAQYAVTRFHFRPAIARFNLREAFHLLKLRTGNNAHPYVRRLMWPTVDALNKNHSNIISHIKIHGERLKSPFP